MKEGEVNEEENVNEEESEVLSVVRPSTAISKKNIIKDQARSLWLCVEVGDKLQTL